MTELSIRSRWLAFAVVCVGTLMIVLDTTIVNVALPSIRGDLAFTETGLVWVVNAYMLTFGGFLLLGGRLGDLYGHRRLFILGLALFTVTSLACGVAQSRAVLVAARTAQGVGGAVVDAIALSLVIDLFQENDARAKAMGVYGFVCAAGGSIGVLLGGLLTQAFSWHWIFLVNVPIGVAVAVACMRVLPALRTGGDRRLDAGGAIAVTSSLMCAVYAVVDGNRAGWGSPQTVLLLSVALALLAVFLVIEWRSAHPLMPLRLFTITHVWASACIGVLWSASMFAWFFMSALYMQQVLGLGPRSVGLAFLPSNVIMAVFSVGISARMVTRFGFQVPLTWGLLLAAAGLVLFARAPVAGDLWCDVMPGMALLGLGAGMALNPLLMAAMSDVDAAESGVASGVVNTAFMMGGALGLAILASLAGARTESLIADGADMIAALAGGYRLAFAAAAASAAAAALMAFFFIRRSTNAVSRVADRTA